MSYRRYFVLSITTVAAVLQGVAGVTGSIDIKEITHSVSDEQKRIATRSPPSNTQNKGSLYGSSKNA